jgi:DNA-binding NarL/FixJ family response regulator
MKPLRILLADDHALFRKGIASLIAARQDMVVVAEAGDGLEAIERARQVRPDVILMDVNMPHCSGLEALERIKQEMPEVTVIMLTVSEDEADLFTAIKQGANGYLLKNLEPHQLYDKLEKLGQGEAPISGVMAAKMLQEFRQPEENASQQEVGDELTTREIEVLGQVITGATNKDIAEALYITENTVKIHLRNILEKLQVQNRIQAAVYAVRKGLLDEDKLLGE